MCRLQSLPEGPEKSTARQGNSRADEMRLEKAREYKATRKAASTPMEKERTRVRVEAYRAKRTDEEVKRDREAAYWGMRKLRSNQAAPKWSSQEKHDQECIVRKWRLLIAEGADAGQEPQHSGGIRYYCHICDQDPTVPLAGSGRCHCYDCAVLHDKVDEWMERGGGKVRTQDE